LSASGAVPETPPSRRLILFVAGATSRSHRAIRNLRQISIDTLRGQSDVEVIDIYQQPELAAKYQVNVAPTLLRVLPLPWRRIVGDLSETDRVIQHLELQANLASAKSNPDGTGS
jgi:circadian clock protein KaiB